MDSLERNFNGFFGIYCARQCGILETANAMGVGSLPRPWCEKSDTRKAAEHVEDLVSNKSI